MKGQQTLPISRGTMTSVILPRSKDEAFLLPILPFKFTHHMPAPMPVSRQGIGGRDGAVCGGLGLSRPPCSAFLS